MTVGEVTRAGEGRSGLRVRGAREWLREKGRPGAEDGHGFGFRSRDGGFERVDRFVPLRGAEAEHTALGLESDSRFKSALPLWEFANGNISSKGFSEFNS